MGVLGSRLESPGVRSSRSGLRGAVRRRAAEARPGQGAPRVSLGPAGAGGTRGAPCFPNRAEQRRHVSVVTVCLDPGQDFCCAASLSRCCRERHHVDGRGGSSVRVATDLWLVCGPPAFRPPCWSKGGRGGGQSTRVWRGRGDSDGSGRPHRGPTERAGRAGRLATRLRRDSACRQCATNQKLGFLSKF